MDFLQSETLLNLARAFAGESQARSRYSIYAAAARKEGHELLARLFEDTAHNELEHAEQFFALISQLSRQAPVNLRIDAGYPFPLGDTAANLAYAAEGEQAEHAEVYPRLCPHRPGGGLSCRRRQAGADCRRGADAPDALSPRAAGSHHRHAVSQRHAGDLALRQLRTHSPGS